VWKQIQNHLGIGDIAFCLGDCIDRGSSGYEILCDIIKDKRIIMLKGNHEEFLEEYLRTRGRYEYELWTCKQNGGYETFKRIMKCSEDSLAWWHSWLTHLPLEQKILNNSGKQIVLTHAGYDPYVAENSTKPINYLWDREHIFLPWNEEEYPNAIMIHGHTPVQNIRYAFKQKGLAECDIEIEELEHPTVLKYAGGHKYCIDLGTPHSGTAALMNIDTLEVIYFKGE
jgi:predicted phosphodiesterase